MNNLYIFFIILIIGFVIYIYLQNRSKTIVPSDSNDDNKDPTKPKCPTDKKLDTTQCLCK